MRNYSPECRISMGGEIVAVTAEDLEVEDLRILGSPRLYL